MISNTHSSSFPEENYQYPPYQRQESWENYLQFNSEDAFNTLGSPAPVEMVFEKPTEPPAPTMEEEFVFDPSTIVNYTEQDFMSNMEEIDFSELAEMRDFDYQKNQRTENNQYNENETSQCSRCHSEEELEELGSISTKDSIFADFSNFDENFSYNWDENSVADQTFDLETELREKIVNFANERSDEEKEYIKKVFPLLMNSLKQICSKNPIQLTNDIICSILKELIYGKELMIGAEKQVLGRMANNEINYLKSARPDAMVTEDDLMVHKRKEKKASKGNRNSSNLNHLNENYVSNIFQFAKRNYPDDREIQRIGNERNVSAANFKKLMRPKLTDDIWTRQAKARISANGQELIGNIEYWMKDGYFEQCADREKYILHKEKALRDLALSGRY